MPSVWILIHWSESSRIFHQRGSVNINETKLLYIEKSTPDSAPLNTILHYRQRILILETLSCET